MLPDLRIVVGAILVAALFGLTGLGLFATVRPSQQAKMGPLETARNQTFNDSAEWNQFYEADSVRRFVGLARRAEAVEATEMAPPLHAQDGVETPTATALAPVEAPNAASEAAPAAVIAERSATEETTANAQPQVASLAAAPPTVHEPQHEATILETTILETTVLEATDVEPVVILPRNTDAAEAGATDPVANMSDTSEQRLVDSKDRAVGSLAALAPSEAPQSQADAASPPSDSQEPVVVGDANWDQEPWDMAAQIVEDENVPSGHNLMTAPVALPDAAKTQRVMTPPRRAAAVRRAVADPEPRPRTPRVGASPYRSTPQFGGSRYDSLLHTVHPYQPRTSAAR